MLFLADVDIEIWVGYVKDVRVFPPVDMVVGVAKKQKEKGEET